MNSIIQITKNGLVFSEKDTDIKKLHNEFQKNHYIKLPQLLEPSLLKFIQARIEEAAFREKDYKYSLGVDSKELRLKDETTVGILEFLANDLTLFQFIEKVTSCPKVGCFGGRVYRMSPNLGIYDAWHDDAVDNRMIAMSVNLSTEVYSGGILQIQDYNSGKIIQEVSNTSFGDAVIFRVSLDLMHRVTEVIGTASRTALAGWFYSKPIYAPIFSPLINTTNLNCNGHIWGNSTNISNYTILKRADDLFFRHLNEQTLVFNPRNTVCYGLDSTGEKVLQLLEKPRTVKEIKQIILEEYDVDSKTCEEDLITLLDKLESWGIVGSVDKIQELNNNLSHEISWDYHECKRDF